MAFSDGEIARYTDLLEKDFWAKHRPPLHLRHKVREGQTIEGHEVVLFLVRPYFRDPTQHVYEWVAKARYVRTRNVWWVFWHRADGKWHRYPPCPEVKSFEAFLKLVDEDTNACFWG